MRKSKKVTNILIIIFAMLIILYNIFPNLNSNKAIFGYKTTIVQEYQEQGKIKKNNVLFIKTNLKEYNENDIVVIRISKSIYFHTIVDKSINNTYKTKGEDNINKDNIILKSSDIYGKVVLNIPFIGVILKNKIIFLILSIIIIFRNTYVIKKKNEKIRRYKLKQEQIKKNT